jgi:hypothetical protein
LRLAFTLVFFLLQPALLRHRLRHDSISPVSVLASPGFFLTGEAQGAGSLNDKSRRTLVLRLLPLERKREEKLGYFLCLR